MVAEAGSRIQLDNSFPGGRKKLFKVVEFVIGCLISSVM